MSLLFFLNEKYHISNLLPMSSAWNNLKKIMIELRHVQIHIATLSRVLHKKSNILSDQTH